LILREAPGLRYSRLSRALGTNDRGGRNDGDGDHVATPPAPQNYAPRAVTGGIHRDA